MKKYFLLPVFLTGMIFCHAQKREAFKFSKITLDDVRKKFYSVDSGANAVVIGDVGEAEVDRNGLRYKRHKRVHILKKGGYEEATFQVEDNSEIKASTFNEENGQLVEYKLAKENIFKEKATEGYNIIKFTLPNVKEGSIIDVSYSLSTEEYAWIEPWRFQGFNPTVYSEFNLTVSDDLDFSFVKKGYQPLAVYDRKVGGGMTYHTWVMKDVPAAKQENYVSSVWNFVSTMQFNLVGVKFRPMLTWPDLAKNLLNNPNFGESLTRNNNWLKDIVQPLVKDANDPLEKSRRIYEYVRDNINCTGHNGLFLSQSLKEIIKNRKGSVSDINLLLSAMLNYVDINSTPVLLSTKNHGYISTVYPVMSRFNYVIVSAPIEGKTYFLDASYRQLGFGRLLPDCYNGQARLINTEAGIVDLISDSLKEREVSFISLADDKGKWKGRMQKMPTYYESFQLRKKIEDKGMEVYSKELLKDYSLEDAEFDNLQVDSLKKYDYPVLLRYDLSVGNKTDVIYLNPMFGEGYNENPFKAGTRLYPVEMPYAIDKTHIANIEVPEGFVVDEVPKSIRIRLNEQDEGGFEYIVNQSGNSVSLTSRVYLKKATFLAQDYEDLREFFNLVVSKQKEQIVFKKKN